MLLRHVLARAALDIVIKTQLATICLTPGGCTRVAAERPLVCVTADRAEGDPMLKLKSMPGTVCFARAR
jgi:hypothetical protein